MASLSSWCDNDYSVTLVTMAFDLRTLEQTPGRRPWSFYQKEGINLLKSGLPLVIFTSSDLAETIRDQIIELKLENITIIVVNPRQLIPQLPRITDILMKIPGLLDQEKPHSPLYVNITWSKFKFLHEIATDNPYRTTHICWVDYGLTHIAPYHLGRHLSEITKTLWLTPDLIDKIHINVITTVDWDDQPDKYWDHFSDGVAAGIFGGPLNSIIELCDDFWPIADMVLEKGFAPHEQTILTYMFSKSHQKFQPWFGQYCSIGYNWGGIYQLTDYLLDLANSSNELGYRNQHTTKCNLWISQELSRQLLDSCIKNRYELTGSQKSHLLNIMFMSCWYKLYPNGHLEACTDIGRIILDYYQNDSDCCEAINSSRAMFTAHLQFVGLTLPDISS